MEFHVKVSMRVSGSIWEHLKAYGIIWEHLGASGSIWEEHVPNLPPFVAFDFAFDVAFGGVGAIAYHPCAQL